LVAFFLKNLIDLDLSDEVDPVWWKKNAFVRFYHRDAHYYVIISHNTSAPMIGRLELATGTLMSHASWVWLIKISPWSQIFLRCVRADLDLIMNAEHLAWIDRIDRIFEKEHDHYFKGMKNCW